MDILYYHKFNAVKLEGLLQASSPSCVCMNSESGDTLCDTWSMSCIHVHCTLYMYVFYVFMCLPGTATYVFMWERFILPTPKTAESTNCLNIMLYILHILLVPLK